MSSSAARSLLLSGLLLGGILGPLPRPARADERVLTGLDWMTQFPPTWNAGSPKVVSDGLHTYAALCGFNGDTYLWSIVRKRGIESQWQQGAPVFRTHQPPVVLLDRKGRLNVFYNYPQLHHLRFDHPAIDLSSYQEITFPFSSQASYLGASYDALTDTLMLVFNESTTWTLHFTTRTTDGNWAVPTPLPRAPAGMIHLYARPARSSAKYSIVASEHPLGAINAAYVAVVLLESASVAGPWQRRDLYRVTGQNLGIPYQNFVFASDLQADAQGRNRVLIHVNEEGSGHTPFPEGLYLAREEDNYQLRHIRNTIDDAFPLHIHPNGSIFAFAKLIHWTPTPHAGKIVYFRSDDSGLTWSDPQPITDDGLNPMAIEPRSGSLSGGKEQAVLYSAPLLPPFHTVWYTTLPMALANSRDRFDFWSFGADGNRDYVRSFREAPSGRSYYYTYDYRADGSNTVSYFYSAGSYYRVYVAHSNGAIRYHDSDGFSASLGPPEPFSCNGLEAPLAPVLVNGYRDATTGLATPRWRWEPGSTQCGPIRSWLVCPSWGACETLERWVSDYEPSAPLAAGTYTITIQAQNEYGQSPALVDAVTVCPYGTSGCLASGPGSVRMEPRDAGGTLGVSDLEGVRFKLEVVEDETCASAKSGWASVRSFGVPARDSYGIETELHSKRVSYTDGLCGASGLCAEDRACGLGSVDEASLRVAVVDSVLQGRAGARTSDPAMFPRQTHGIEPGTGAYRTEMISQADVTEEEIDVILQKATPVADAAGWRFCPTVGQGTVCDCPWGASLVPCPDPDLLLETEPYRRWEATVSFGGRSYTLALALPEQDGQFAVLEGLSGESLHTGGAFRMRMSDVRVKRRDWASWEPVGPWVVTGRDGYRVDFGFKKTVIGGREYLELASGLGDVYLAPGQSVFVGPPARATLVAPLGTVTTHLPTYQWNEVGGATEYYLWVNNPGEVPVVQRWYPSGPHCSSGTCAATPSSPLVNGSHRWWIQAKNPAGLGPWSAPMSFTVNSTGAPPAVATLLYPSGTVSTPMPAYQWSAALGGAEYYLWVSGPSGAPVIQDWYQAAAVCSGSACSVTPATVLADGMHRWWLQARNPSGTGPWSSGTSFTVSRPPPGQPTLLSPSGTITVTMPTYRWNETVEATQYYLWVNGPSGAPVIQQWHSAASLCASGSCALTPAQALDNGSHTWWIQARSPAGTGPWSGGMTFLVDALLPPGRPTLLSPSGTIATPSPDFRWNEVAGASDYYLWVNGPAGTPVTQQWFVAGAVCSNGVCSATASGSLAQGAHRWWIQARNGAGTGPWSAALDFTVNSFGPPAAPTLVSPSGTETATSPTYRWNGVAGATEYYLWVNGPAETRVVQQWYVADTVCSGGRCTATPAASLLNGPHQWWIQAKNVAGSGPWSAGMTFTASSAATPPAVATLLSPSGAVSTATPTYQWQEAAGATEYYLWVNGPSNTPVIQQWYPATSTCSAGACSATPASPLGVGPHRWWIQARNPAGTGPWTAPLSFARQ